MRPIVNCVLQISASYYSQFRFAGIDTIICVSVNDAYVMKHWAEDLGVSQDKIMFLADGNGEFTKS